MTNKRMNKLLCELNLPEGTVYMPDVENILKKCEKKIEKREKKAIHVISPSRVLAVAVIVVLMLALSIVAFGKDGVIRKIITIFEEAETEQAATDEEKDVYVPDADSEEEEIPTEIVTEEIEEVVEEAAEEKKTEKAPEEQSEVIEFVTAETIIEVPKEPVKIYIDNTGMNDIKKDEGAEDYINTPGVSVEDDDYKVTLIETMGDSYNLYIKISVEAKNMGATERLAAGSLIFDTDIKTDKGWQNIAGCFINEVSFNDGVKVFTISAQSDHRGDFTEARIGCDLMDLHPNGKNYIVFKVNSTVQNPKTEKNEVIEFPLSGQEYTGGYISITPLGLNIKIKVRSNVIHQVNSDPDLVLVFRDGTRKTYRQLTRGGSGTFTDIDKVYSWGTYVCQFREIMDLNEIEYIICNNIRYNAKDPTVFVNLKESNTEIVTAENNVKILEGEYPFRYPVYLTDVLDVIDFYYTTDLSFVEFTWDNVTYRVEAGKGEVTAGGEPRYFLVETPVADSKGGVIVGKEFLNKVLGMSVNLSNDETCIVIK